jgi:hypothetical protein
MARSVTVIEAILRHSLFGSSRFSFDRDVCAPDTAKYFAEILAGKSTTGSAWHFGPTFHVMSNMRQDPNSAVRWPQTGGMGVKLPVPENSHVPETLSSYSNSRWRAWLNNDIGLELYIVRKGRSQVGARLHYQRFSSAGKVVSDHMLNPVPDLR